VAQSKDETIFLLAYISSFVSWLIPVLTENMKHSFIRKIGTDVQCDEGKTDFSSVFISVLSRISAFIHCFDYVTNVITVTTICTSLEKIDNSIFSVQQKKTRK
jgi:hypothetical protein